MEILASRDEYASRGILSWDILQLDSRFMLAGRMAWVFRTLLGYPGYPALIALQFILAITVVAHAYAPLLPVSITGILGIKLLSHLRNAHGGLDGSDQMQIIVLVSLAFFSWTADTEMRTIALWFIAAQSMLSYLAAGMAKLASPVWRSGAAIVGIMATDNYGSGLLGPWLQRNRSIAIVVCWSVILFECLGPFAVFGGRLSCLLFIGCGLLFHLVIAVTMGLNTFLWSFASAYPAVYFLSMFFWR